MIDRRSILSSLFGLVLAAALFQPRPAVANELEARGEKFINALANEAIESLTKPDTPRDERIKRFRRMFGDHFAVRAIGKFVLGRYWERATEKERAEYLALFEDLMVVSYVDRFQRYAGENLRVTQSRAENGSTVSVFTDIVRPGTGKPVQVIWRIGVGKDTMKILDVMVEGTSLSQTLRSDFGSIISQRNGQVAGLIHELRLKTTELKLPEKN
jgi:phospholipid transport system substrate-binding protein